MKDAVFTASPQISKLNRRLSTTPEMTGPVWIPILSSSAGARILSLCPPPRYFGQGVDLDGLIQMGKDIVPEPAEHPR